MITWGLVTMTATPTVLQFGTLTQDLYVGGGGGDSNPRHSPSPTRLQMCPHDLDRCGGRYSCLRVARLQRAWRPCLNVRAINFNLGPDILNLTGGCFATNGGTQICGPTTGNPTPRPWAHYFRRYAGHPRGTFPLHLQQRRQQTGNSTIADKQSGFLAPRFVWSHSDSRTR